jgi:antirestriction protein ArdC
VRSEGERAYYSPSGDFIQMPPKSSFEKAHEYYGVLAHESVHWSGHESRLNRLSKFARFGDEAYAMEDLNNVTAYLGHWLKVLQRDHSAIFTAASAANAAADHILSYSRTNDQPEVEEAGSELVAA